MKELGEPQMELVWCCFRKKAKRSFVGFRRVSDGAERVSKGTGRASARAGRAPKKPRGSPGIKEGLGAGKK